MAIHNFNNIKYPRHLIEWIIVDDSTTRDLESDIKSALGSDDRVKYYYIGTKNGQHEKRMTIGEKRNRGVELATSDIIAFMDDDDYYYPINIYTRVSTLLTYIDYECCGVCELDVYDVVSGNSARFTSRTMSEASMCFYKKFWMERKFPTREHTLGEGYPFVKGRTDKIISFPSCFCILAMTHGGNYTGNKRIVKINSLASALDFLDYKEKMFVYEWINNIKE